MRSITVLRHQLPAAQLSLENTRQKDFYGKLLFVGFVRVPVATLSNLTIEVLMIKRERKLFLGVGINDADYNVYWRDQYTNKAIICPFYKNGRR